MGRGAFGSGAGVWVIWVVLSAFACTSGGDDDDAAGGATVGPNADAAIRGTADDDTSDDDAGDDTGDDDQAFEPWVNPQARANAFRLFYKERLARGLLAYNRFLLVGDVVPAHTLGATNIAKSGATYDIQLHPKDNNEIGTSAFNVYQAYRVFGTRDLALTLIRQFEGLAVAEEVSGIPGLTCREWQTGFDVTIDGPAGTIERTKYGAPVEPAETYAPELEGEIVDAFFADGVFTYRGDPSEYYFTIEPILHPGDYAVTLVFEEMPYFLRVSNCCSSFMVSQLGTFAGYFWGNHNSRDNFPDYALGYFAACAAKDDESTDADVRASAARACASGRRIGDSVVSYGYNLMTVPEFVPYDAEHLMVAGELRPDGTDEGLEWLGSMNSCQMSYMAKALSSAGLRSPDEEVQIPGAYEILPIKLLFELIGLAPPPITKTCRGLDDAYFGLTWQDFLELKVGDSTLWDLVGIVLNVAPDTVVPVLLSLADATHQPEKSAYALVYYARTFGERSRLLQETRETLYHILEVQRRAAQMALDWAQGQPEPPPDVVAKAEEELALAALYAHASGVGSEEYDVFGFQMEEGNLARLEAVLARGDSPPRALWSDEAIWQSILDELASNADRPNTVNRYWARFPTPDDRPMWRSGDGYRVIGLDGEFHEIPNISHQWFGGVDLWNSMPMCGLEPTVLDCSWAALGCARPDLDGSRSVDAADQALFDAAWATYGPPDEVPCDAGNGWCAGADLDRNGALDEEDQAFMAAAAGCWY